MKNKLMFVVLTMASVTSFATVLLESAHDVVREPDTEVRDSSKVVIDAKVGADYKAVAERNTVADDGSLVDSRAVTDAADADKNGGLDIDSGNESDTSSVRSLEEQWSDMVAAQEEKYDQAATSTIFQRAMSWSIGNAKEVIGVKEEDLNGVKLNIAADAGIIEKEPALEDAYAYLTNMFDAFDRAVTADYDSVDRSTVRLTVADLQMRQEQMMQQYAEVLDYIIKNSEGLDSSSTKYLTQIKQFIDQGDYESVTTASPELMKILMNSGSKGGSLLLSQMMMMQAVVGKAIGELSAKIAVPADMVTAVEQVYAQRSAKDIYKVIDEGDFTDTLTALGDKDGLERLQAMVEAGRSLVEQGKSFGRSSSGNADATYDALVKGTESLVDLTSEDYLDADYETVQSSRVLLQQARARMLAKYVDSLTYLASKTSSFGTPKKYKTYVDAVSKLVETGQWDAAIDYQPDVLQEMLGKSSSKKASVVSSQMKVVAKRMGEAIDDLKSLEATKKPVSDSQLLNNALEERQRWFMYYGIPSESSSQSTASTRRSSTSSSSSQDYGMQEQDLWLSKFNVASQPVRSGDFVA